LAVAVRKPLRSERELEAYQLSMGLLVRVQGLIAKLPGEERYELASQMRRASRSILANIAEGFAKRESTKEFKHYMRTAMGSANEMKTHLHIAATIGYVTEPELSELVDGYDHVARQLNRLIANWRRF
jgi:four helix bundle protein